MRTIRRYVFETNSSSMHAITVCSPTYNDEYKTLSKRLELFFSNDEYNIEIECNNDLLKAPFDTRSYHIHDDARSMLMYWLASVIQHYNKRLYHLKNDDKEYGSKKIYNEIIFKEFDEYINKIADELGRGIEHILEKPVNLKFVYSIGKHRDRINYSDNPNAWFSTGCYDNEAVYFALRSYYDILDWISSEDCKLFCSSDEIDNTKMFKDIIAAKDAYIEKYKVYINGYEKCKETYEEDCAFEDMMKKGLTRDFQVIWPVGG